MNTVNIKTLKPAKRYEKGLLYCLDNKDKSKVLSELDLIIETVKNNDELKEFLFHPLVKNEDKKDVISKVFPTLEKETFDFISLLIESKRLDCLYEIRNSLEFDIEKENNIVNCSVTLAIEPDSEIKNGIVEKLEKKLKSKVRADFILDEKIIGGMIIKIDDSIIDLSINKKLENFKKM